MASPPGPIFIIPFLLGACLLWACQTTSIGTALHAWDDDLPRIAALRQGSERAEGQQVVALFPKGSVGAAEKAEIIERLDRGVSAAKAFVGKKDWSFRGDHRVYFYFPDDQFVSHAPGGNIVFIPLWRIKED